MESQSNDQLSVEQKAFNIHVENAVLIFHLESTISHVLSMLKSCGMGDEVARIVKRCYESDDVDAEIDKYLEISKTRTISAQRTFTYYKYIESQKETNDVKAE